MHFTTLQFEPSPESRSQARRRDIAEWPWLTRTRFHALLVVARHSRGRCTRYGYLEAREQSIVRFTGTPVQVPRGQPAGDEIRRVETQSVYTRRSVPAWPVATLVLWPGYLRSIPTTSYTQLPPRTIPFLSSTPRCYPCPFCSVRVSEREIRRCHSNIWFTVPLDRMPVVPPFIANPLVSSRILAENPVTSASRSFCSCEDKVHFSCAEGLDTSLGGECGLDLRRDWIALLRREVIGLV